MQKQNLFRFGFIAILLVTSLILLRSSRSSAGQEDACCLKTCPQKKREIREPEMIWESLSRQFFSAVTLP